MSAVNSNYGGGGGGGGGGTRLIDFVGNWIEDPSASESLAPILSRLGVRKKTIETTLANVTKQSISLQDVKLSMTYTSALGHTTDRHVVNGGFRTLKFKDEEPTVTECIFDPKLEFPLAIKTKLPAGKGTMHDERRVIDQGNTIEQRLCHKMDGLESALVVHRFWRRTDQLLSESANTSSPSSFNTSSYLNSGISSPNTSAISNNNNNNNNNNISSPSLDLDTSSLSSATGVNNEDPYARLERLFSGKWIIDESRSETIEPVLIDLGMSKKTVQSTLSTKIVHQMILEGDTLTLINCSDCGDFRAVHRVNEPTRTFTNNRGDRIRTTCTVDPNQEYQIVIRSMSYDGRGSTIDMRKIGPDGSEFYQKLVFSLAGGNATREIVVNRVWVRQDARPILIASATVAPPPAPPPLTTSTTTSTTSSSSSSSGILTQEEIKNSTNPESSTKQQIKQSNLTPPSPQKINYPAGNTNDKNIQEKSAAASKLEEEVSKASLPAFSNEINIIQTWMTVKSNPIMGSLLSLLFIISFQGLLSNSERITPLNALFLGLLASICAYLYFRFSPQFPQHELNIWTVDERWVIFHVLLLAATVTWPSDWLISNVFMCLALFVRRTIPDAIIIPYYSWILSVALAIFATLAMEFEHSSVFPLLLGAVYFRFRVSEGELSPLLLSLDEERMEQEQREINLSAIREQSKKIETIHVTDYRIVGGKFAEYLVETKMAGSSETIKVWRRYSSFRALRRDLKKRHDYRLPAKHAFFNLAVDVLEERRTSLDSFLQSLLSDPNVLDNPVFLSFLEI